MTDVITQHFVDILLPRNRGLIGVVQHSCFDDTGHRVPCFSVYLGATSRFMLVKITGCTIVLTVAYPTCIVTRLGDGTWVLADRACGVSQLSKDKKLRKAQLDALVAGNEWAVGRYYGPGVTSMMFDLSEPHSLTKAEFYIHTIISKVKYMIDSAGKLKPNVELEDLFELATKEYYKKVLAQRRHGPKHANPVCNTVSTANGINSHL